MRWRGHRHCRRRKFSGSGRTVLKQDRLAGPPTGSAERSLLYHVQLSRRTPAGCPSTRPNCGHCHSLRRRQNLSRAAFGAGGSQVLVKEAATEAVVKSRPLVDYRVLHLAAHGIMSTKFPARSALVLRPAGGEDGLLQAREILDLRVNAALVTLSAWTRALLFHFERCFISALLPARSVRPCMSTSLLR